MLREFHIAINDIAVNDQKTAHRLARSPLRRHAEFRIKIHVVCLRRGGGRAMVKMAIVPRNMTTPEVLEAWGASRVVDIASLRAFFDAVEAAFDERVSPRLRADTVAFRAKKGWNNLVIGRELVPLALGIMEEFFGTPHYHAIERRAYEEAMALHAIAESSDGVPYRRAI